MKKLLLTLTDNDEVILHDLKEVWSTKTDTATIRKALQRAYADKKTIQEQIMADAGDNINLTRRIDKRMLDELDDFSKEVLLNELYKRLTEKD